MRKPATELVSGDIVFVGPQKLAARVERRGECCLSEFVPPDIRRHATKAPVVFLDLSLSRSIIDEVTGVMTRSLRTFVKPERLVEVREPDSQAEPR